MSSDRVHWIAADWGTTNLRCWALAANSGRRCERPVCHDHGHVADSGSLAGTEVPTDRKIDGKNIWPLLTGKPDARSAYDAFFYYVRDSQLSAVRKGKWKLHLRAPSERWAGRLPKEALLATKPKTATPWLYDLSEDIGETKNLAGDNPEVVASLTRRAKEFDRKLDEEMRPAYRAEISRK